MKRIVRTVYTIIACFTAVLILLPTGALAATIHVPAEQPTIQDGIDAASVGDLVLVSPGTYVENIDFLGKAITVQGEGGPESTVIDGNQAGSVVTFDHVETVDSVIDGFTIRNGSGFFYESNYYGGGIECASSCPTIMNCTISQNNADYGGGIFCYDASPTIENCTISQNSADDHGGGIICYDSSATIRGCTILENSAVLGGGILCATSSLTIDNCTISKNSTDDHGGGIACYESSSTIINSRVLENSADEWGGGIYCDSSSSTMIDHCTISKNISGDDGGGIYLISSSSTVTDCTISENRTGDYGGGIASRASSPTITNCTISGNRSPNRGGGIACLDDSFPTITSCMILGNTASSGGGIGSRYSLPTIEDCTIQENNAGQKGGGISCGDATVTNCLISRNTAAFGGGIYCGGSPLIRNCTISENISLGGMADYNGGGGILCDNSEAAITDCWIWGNTAENGGGIYCYYDPFPTITNCTITLNNVENKGGGVYCYWYSSPILNHCTISENTAGNYGGGLFCRSSATPTITNCILWGDSASSDPEISVESDSPVVTYSNVQGGWPGVGNIDFDPLFTGGGDYHITVGSPCIDGGTDVGVLTDMDGDVRPQGAGFDMGADENLDCWDYDGDHSPDEACGGGDCDDTDPLRFGESPELCDGSDNDCDEFVPEDEVDGDGDSWMICAGDCDDTDSGVNPGATEGPYGDPTCSDGLDNDCNGLIDAEEQECTCWDGDEDGFYDDSCGGDDCDDTNPEAHPDASEICDNGIDDDCDGLIDSDQLGCRIIHVPADHTAIQDAIHTAVDGDRILVAAGIFVENLDFQGKAITLQSEGGPDTTFIDGNKTGLVVTFESGETASSVIDGFTIRNGFSLHGGGIFCNGASPRITNCTISENNAERSGGGIFCNRASPRITNCTISGNLAGSGGAISCFRQCNLTLTNCRISENITEVGGAVDSDLSRLKITNCMITDNEVVREGGAIWSDQSLMTITNCTISGNSSGRYGGGICCVSCYGTITNSILWGDSAPVGPELYLARFSKPATLIVSYADVQGGESAAYVESDCILQWEQGNIDEDPLFIGGGYFHLRPGSPCVDAGVDTGVYYDIDGQSRPFGTGFDIGADEFSTEPCSVIASSGNQFAAFYLLPALAFIFFSRRFLSRKQSDY